MSQASVEVSEPETSTAPPRALRIEAMIFVGLIIVLAIGVLVGASTIREPLGSTNTLGARVVPYAVGALLLISAITVLIQQLRGRFGEPDGGEDVDLEASTSWMTTVIVLISFASLIVTIPWFGWPIGVAVVFAGSAIALGARRWWVAVLVGIAMGVVTQVAFGTLLGLSLPPTGTLTSWIGL
ncbi:tripartite tricarboxylate transporter TctB family protein [Microbacterium gorillae]|uniref:tripartite tricarboxylate transporter TctB family protein n=1 Tax=Microbacterium gorillae TaxID=1231063 RepID=UPI0006948DE0|nr:tripartite tricarboxylate transporter TctB family protein [Microbacterium gorillae]